MLERPCLLVMAGGTGGHIFPGLAVARVLRKKGWDIHWLGTKRGLEASLIPKENLPLHFISIAGLMGTKWLNWLAAPFRMLLALVQAVWILRKVKPTVVLGMGGFVSGPGGVAARFLNIPLLIHDQNAIVSMTNRYLAYLADRIMVAFPKVLSNKQALYVGNPVREEIAAISPPKERLSNRSGPIHILILGGSRGAQAINQCVPLALAKLKKSCDYTVWHQTGSAHLEQTQSIYQTHHLAARIDPFIEDMVVAYTWADIVICRAGALTIAELTAVGVGSILIPFPFAVKDHQTHNARWLTEAGAGVLLPQTELTPDRLATCLEHLCLDRSQLLRMAEAARQLAMPEALNQIINHCIEVGSC